MPKSVEPSYPKIHSSGESPFPYADIQRDDNYGTASEWANRLLVKKGLFRHNRNITKAVDATLASNLPHVSEAGVKVYDSLFAVAGTWDRADKMKRAPTTSQLGLKASYAMILENNLFAPVENDEFTEDIEHFRTMPAVDVREFGRAAWGNIQRSHRNLGSLYHDLDRALTDARRRNEQELTAGYRQDQVRLQRAALLLPYILKVHDVLSQDKPEWMKEENTK